MLFVFAEIFEMNERNIKSRINKSTHFAATRIRPPKISLVWADMCYLDALRSSDVKKNVRKTAAKYALNK